MSNIKTIKNQKEPIRQKGRKNLSHFTIWTFFEFFKAWFLHNSDRFNSKKKKNFKEFLNWNIFNKNE